MAQGEWLSVNIGLPDEVSDALEQVNSVLETISTLLEITVSILEVIKAFLVNLPSPLQAILTALLAILESILNDLKHTGLYMYIDLPDRSIDGRFGLNIKGGMTGWRSRMAYALLNPNVANRPAFSNSANVVSFHFVATSGNLASVLAQMGVLVALFKQQARPDWDAPVGVSVRPINKEFYESYYDQTTGYISESLIEAKESSIRQLSSGSLEDEFEVGGSQVGQNRINSILATDTVSEALDLDLNLVVRYDYLTGQEIIIDELSGAILTTGEVPDATLITWNIPDDAISQTYRIERTQTQGGGIETYDVRDSAGNTVSSNEIVRDSDGDPVTTVTKLDDVTVEWGDAHSLTNRSAYLDSTVQAGETYWYRVVRVYGSDPVTTRLTESVTSLDPKNQVIAKLITLLRAIVKATQAEAPSEFKACYIPNKDDLALTRNLALTTTEGGGGWWMGTRYNQRGWIKVGVGDLLDPLIIALDELKSFVDMMFNAIGGIVDELVALIELLETRINTLNTFIEMLQAIIAVLQTLEDIEFGLLTVVSDTGNQGLLGVINDSTLEGAPDASGEDYVASVTLLGGTANTASAINALRLIFGI